jgi:hypothetical protein
VVNVVVPESVTVEGRTYKVERLPDIESLTAPPTIHLRVRDGDSGGDALIDSAFLGVDFVGGYDPITTQLEALARKANREKERN